MRIGEVVGRGAFILGPEVEAFEREFADYLGVRHVVGVANGTDAITIALRALGVEPGDEVVVPSFTFYATAEAVVTAGARPVFCDVDRDTRNVTRRDRPGRARRRAPRRSSPSTCSAARRRCRSSRALGLPVLEDAAQAAGASARRAQGRRARRRRHVLVLPVQEPRLLRRRRRDRDRRRRASPSSRGRCASTARATSRRSSTSATTRASTSSRRRSCGCCCRELDGWCDGRRAAAARLRRRRARRARDAAGGARRRRAGVAPVRRHAPARRRAAGGAERARASRRAPTTARRCTASRRWRRTPRDGPPLPVTDELARTNLALPMSPVLGAEQAEQVVAALAAGGVAAVR